MYKAIHLSPMIPSFSIRETIDFFKDLFGFKIALASENYFVIYKHDLTIHLLRAGEDIGEMEFYLEVDNIDTLWETIKDKLDGIKVRAPFDREYGMREFHIIVPHTKTLMFVGQAIK